MPGTFHYHHILFLNVRKNGLVALKIILERPLSDQVKHVLTVISKRQVKGGHLLEVPMNRLNVDEPFQVVHFAIHVGLQKCNELGFALEEFLRSADSFLA